ncbi:MAG: HAMP domain-containing histidine kinase [Acidobacteria bacterium]|nr:HAMP domain-containing histidine kinase [Acidobacteriota bacterium]
MRFLPERTHTSILLVISIVTILIVLAVLQHQWIGQVSEAEHERMHTSLLASVNQFRLQFDYEFRQLGFLLQPDLTVLIQRDWQSYAASCDAVLKRSNYHLVRNIYVWTAGKSEDSQLLKLNRDEKAFEAVSWPSGFEQIQVRYSRFLSNPSRPDPELRPFIWTMFYRIPLMIQPLMTFRPSPVAPGPAMQFRGFLLLELNRETIRENLIPELAKKHFQGPDGFIYQVVVTNGHGDDSLLYRSDPQLTIAAFARPDARMSLFENPPERFDPMRPMPGQDMQPSGRGLRPPPNAAPGPPMAALGPAPRAPQQRNSLAPALSGVQSPGWELMAKHREGSLEAAIAIIRQRNLAISLGSLLLLAFSIAFIILSARRAQRLARLQIDFVAGISHELRTPLAVICSAGDNLAEGVIEDSSRSARKYGELVRNEGRKLADMIEHILQFASLQRGRPRLNLRPGDINEVVESVLKQSMPAITAAGFTIEKTLAPDLPRINLEPAVLFQVIQNLIQNAVRYSGESRWLAVRTAKASAKRGTEVQFIVQDKGIGIDREDLTQIFKPFYRGSAAAAAQIHGTGLGLFVVREALAAMGAGISVKSSRGKGSVFTAHFPALPSADDSPVSAASKGLQA